MDALPDCAATCLAKAFPASSCSISDFGCLCLDQQLIASTQACGLQACTIKENLSSQKALYTVCNWPVSEDRTAFPVVLIVGLVLAVISVSLRGVVRTLTRNIGFDDALAFLSLCAIIALSGLGFENQKLGLGIDMWFLSFQEITDFLHYYFAIETLYLASIALTKTSMLCLYLRLFPEKKIRTAVIITLAITAAWGASILLANIFSCQPVSYMWLQWDGEHEGHCVDHASVMNAHAVTNIVFDVLIIGLPMPTLLKLNMGVKKKVGVVFMFAVGLVVTVISILRCIELIRFDIEDNPTRKIVNVSIWSVVEVDLSIVCACMPSIRAFISYIHNIIYGKSGTNYSYSYEFGSSNARRGHGVSGRSRSRSRATSKTLVPGPSGTYGNESYGFGEGIGAGRKGFIELEEMETRSGSGSRNESQSQSQSQSRSRSRADSQPGNGERRQSKAWFDGDE